MQTSGFRLQAQFSDAYLQKTPGLQSLLCSHNANCTPHPQLDAVAKFHGPALKEKETRLSVPILWILCPPASLLLFSGTSHFPALSMESMTPCVLVWGSDLFGF